MTTTGYPSILERSVATAHLWYQDVADELGTDDLRYAGRALRVVLHVLRDHLSVEEAVQLSAQLPTLIRGIYFEQWKPGATRHAGHDVDALLDEIADAGLMAGRTEASHAVSAVASVLRHHVSPGELDDVLANLSPKVRPLLAPLRGEQ